MMSASIALDTCPGVIAYCECSELLHQRVYQSELIMSLSQCVPLSGAVGPLGDTFCDCDSVKAGNGKGVTSSITSYARRLLQPGPDTLFPLHIAVGPK